MKRKAMQVACLAAVAALTAACGGGAVPAAPASTGASAPAPLQHVVFRMAWLAAGYDAPFVLAKADGYYAKAGLDVSIEQGRSSTSACQTVANGSDNFTFADAGTATEYISKGAPLKVLAVFQQTTPFGFIYGPQVTLKTAADLRGHTILTNAGSGPVQLLPAVLAKAGLTEKDVKIDYLGSPSAEVTTLKAHPNDLLLGVDSSTYVSALQVYPQAKFTAFSALGVNPYSNAIITNLTEIKDHPAVVKAFVAASIQGLRAAQADPEAAVAATVKAFPNAKAPALASGLKMLLAALHTPATQGHPLGWMAASDWQSTVSLLHRYAGMKAVKPLDDDYTNSFLPPA